MTIYKHFARKDGFVLPTVHMCGDSSLSKREVNKATKSLIAQDTPIPGLTSFLCPGFDFWQTAGLFTFIIASKSLYFRHKARCFKRMQDIDRGYKWQ